MYVGGLWENDLNKDFLCFIVVDVLPLPGLFILNKEKEVDNKTLFKEKIYTKKHA